MLTQPSKDDSVQGKGAEILLPPRGNPFTGQPPAVQTPGDEAYPAGAELTTPPLEAAVPLEPPTAVPGAAAAPRDLSPEDLAALFPSQPTEEADPLAGVKPVDLTALPTPGDLTQVAPAAAEPAPEDLLALSPEDLAALQPSSHADRELAGARVAPAAGDMPEGTQVLPVIPATPVAKPLLTMTVAGGAALPGVRAFGGGIQIPEDMGPAPTDYTPGAALAGNQDITAMLVPDARLVEAWAEIDALEAQVAASRNLSLKLAREFLDRLRVARNQLLNDRMNFEEARREMAEVKYRQTAFQQSSVIQFPRAILFYLLACIGVLVTAAGLLISLGSRLVVQGLPGFDLTVLGLTTVFGATGGVSFALYSLWKHAASNCDYDPQYAMWYYMNPLLGAVLSVFVYIMFLAGLLTLNAGQPLANAGLANFVLYFLAWVVGIRPTIAFALANALLKKLIPESEKEGGDKVTEKATDTAAK